MILFVLMYVDGTARGNCAEIVCVQRIEEMLVC